VEIYYFIIIHTIPNNPLDDGLKRNLYGIVSYLNSQNLLVDGERYPKHIILQFNTCMLSRHTLYIIIPTFDKIDYTN
jgi:hypothetical protein